MSEQKYVFEVEIPAEVHWPENERLPVEPAVLFGMDRGYLRPSAFTDHLGLAAPHGFLLTGEFSAANLESAEEGALSIATRLRNLAGFSFGSPPRPCQLLRIARVEDELLRDQWTYFYDELHPSIPLDTAELRGFLERFATLNQDIQSKAELAARWYVLALGASTAVDAYLAVWIGLEAIASTLSRKYHTDGPSTRCVICDHTTGRRNHRDAGLQHLIKANALELLADRTLADLAELRNRVAHALEDISAVNSQCDAIRDDLLLCLGAGILGLGLPAHDPQYGWSAARPRDFEARPDGRAHVTTERLLNVFRPYFGEWVQLERDFTDESSEVRPAGDYYWRGVIGVGVTALVDPRNPPQPDYVAFNREGINRDAGEFEGGRSLPTQDWRVRPITPAWARIGRRAADQA
ncbi:MAG: hypothetical protein WEB00_15725 [Dehalococcoidia bacterium]